MLLLLLLLLLLRLRLRLLLLLRLPLRLLLLLLLLAHALVHVRVPGVYKRALQGHSGAICCHMLADMYSLLLPPACRLLFMALIRGRGSRCQH